MKSTLFEDQVERTHVLVFDTGDEVAEGLRRFAEDNGITAAHFTAIGAFSDVTLGFFDMEARRYHKTAIGEQVEVLTLAGNIAEHQGKPKIHAHVVVGKRDGSAYGGHLLEAHVRPTLEVMIVESAEHLRRVHDETTGLALLKPR